MLPVKFVGIYLIIYIFGVSGDIPREPDPCGHDTLTSTLHEIANNNTHITRLISIGKSVEGRELWVMILSDSPEMRPLLRPQVKFIGNINGFSGPACYLLVRLIQHLVEEYEAEGSRERQLLQNNEVHIIPNMNPDGYVRTTPNACSKAQGRLNARGVNLNRNFPYIFEDDPRSKREPETEAIMRYIHDNNFLFSLSLFSGAFVVTYPFDSVPQPEEGEMEMIVHPTPDDEIFRHLALTYVQNVPGEPWHCPNIERVFPQGITNGAAWEPARGTMMDYNYVKGTYEIMVGVSCCRNPPVRELQGIFDQHGQALLQMIEETEMAVWGQVIDVKTGEVLPQAEILTSEHGVPYFTSDQGEFWRPLLPGKHSLTVRKDGYEEGLASFEVTIKEPTRLLIKLSPLELDPSVTTTTSTTTTASVEIDIQSSTGIDIKDTTTVQSLPPVKIPSLNINISSNVSIPSSRKSHTFPQTLHFMLARVSSSSNSNKFNCLYYVPFLIIVQVAVFQHGD